MRGDDGDRADAASFGATVEMLSRFLTEAREAAATDDATKPLTMRALALALLSSAKTQMGARPRVPSKA